MLLHYIFFYIKRVVLDLCCNILKKYPSNKLCEPSLFKFVDQLINNMAAGVKADDLSCCCNGGTSPDHTSKLQPHQPLISDTTLCACSTDTSTWDDSDCYSIGEWTACTGSEFEDDSDDSEDEDDEEAVERKKRLDSLITGVIKEGLFDPLNLRSQ